ncbi:unnamed protein product [Dibothriocephalus latus]|uniref:Pseudouridine synthase RsuA/RluA-like domain-containing protein n=1 Tax=Dibothriocephalus latus TaxID=60516 RepID=A0A3P7NKG2_DIBLA|nr:unnamed protein product [Dibothriocephalus latus]
MGTLDVMPMTVANLLAPGTPWEDDLPVAKSRPPGESTEPVSPDLGVQDASFIDQTYFREQPLEDRAREASDESVADCIRGVRDQLSINQYTGHTIDFDRGRQAAVFLNRRDSQGFRIPDDDAVKFYKLTEDEATEVLRRCIIFSQENILVLNKPPGISSHGKSFLPDWNSFKVKQANS